MNVRGDWRWILLAMILGLIVLGLSLYFIFHEYFNQDELNFEVCRQSVVLRAGTPEISAVGIDFASFKDEFPLKCKTEVKNIDFENTSRAATLIADSIASCWSLFSKGEVQFFPTSTASVNSYCVPCARIHFDSEVYNYYSDIGDGKGNIVDIGSRIDKNIDRTKVTYRQFLGTGLFSRHPGDFYAEGTSSKPFKFGFIFSLGLPEKVFGNPDGKIHWEVLSDGSVAEVEVPGKLTSDSGDVIVFFQQAVADGKRQHSMVFWLQADQKREDPFEILSQEYMIDRGHTVKLCDYFDGIPA